MKRIFTLVILGIFYLTGTAQPSTTIAQIVSGKVINQVTNEPISYTNIGLENTFIGTASNSKGNFQLKIPKDMVDRNIYFSAVGFKNDTFPVSQLFGREFAIIKLEPKSYDIENVDIARQSKVLQRILRMASENTPYNFIGGPFNLACTYENKKTVDDTIQTKQNIGVLIYDKTGYSSPSKLDAYKWQNYSLSKKQQAVSDFTFSTGMTNLDDMLALDLVRTSSSVLDPEITDRFELNLKQETEIDGSPVWVIEFSEPTPTLAGSGDFYASSFVGEITIAKEDYSVKKIIGKVESPKNNRQGKSLAIGQSVNSYYKNVSYDFTVTYSNLKPDYILFNRTYETREGKKVNEQSRLTVNKVQTTNLKTLTSREYFTGE